MFFRNPYFLYQLSRHLCNGSNQSIITLARTPSGLLPVSSVPVVRSAVHVGHKTGKRRDSICDTMNANERIPCRTSVRRDRCVRSNLLEACPCTRRSQTRAVAAGRVLHAPQRACDLLRRIGAAAWRHIRRSSEGVHHEAETMRRHPEYRESVKTRCRNTMDIRSPRSHRCRRRP